MPPTKPPAAGWYRNRNGMKWSVFLLLAGACLAGDGARLVYTKSFPNSVPAYMQVTLDKAGHAEYKEAEDDPLPLKFQLTPADTETMFELAAKLDYFKHPLESPLKVAFMGMK